MLDACVGRGNGGRDARADKGREQGVEWEGGGGRVDRKDGGGEGETATGERGEMGRGGDREV